MLTTKTLPPILLLFPALISALAISELFKPPDKNNNNHQHILSLNTKNHPRLSQSQGFISLGDSYSAGIGTRPDLTSPSTACRQGLGAYPYLLASSLSPPSHTSHQWLSCTGATTLDLLSSSPSSPDTSQIDAFNSTPTPSFATLSIAGNDLDFFSLLNACVFRFYGPLGSESCPDALKRAEDTLSPQKTQKLKLRIRLILLEILGKIAWERHPSFFITVTGYTRFFNENTTECDDVSFGVWASSSSSGVETMKLTKDTRKKMNDFVVRANHLLESVIDEVNASFSVGRGKKVVFVNYDDSFNHHRFCEPGVVKEPDYERQETWFFLPGGKDVDRAGNVYSSRHHEEDDDDEEDDGVGYLDPERCWEEALERDDWGEKAVCLMAKAKRQDPELKLVEHYRHHCRGGQGKRKGKAVWRGGGGSSSRATRKPGDSMWLTPTYYGKTFHPRSAGHEAIRDKIFEIWKEHGYLTDDRTDL
ncbi:SGNH hydrolase-type esterase domain-containing protein [Triangularia verruculosa]|uniref:SGNH hydrolase-type esterase domain-containing protein n=1 Tax=Triangularia verruculosa TaxID=2587418 RepID=A0AAN7AP49_9PEZI|nr:SGNH hydrolase-type esterase domain-containing protein [Triangularia verruculosa]